jgi:dTDP-4-dehydrorhamnose 3,5-epimerase
VDNPYSAEHDGGIAFDDPDLGIVWPIQVEKAILSDKDKTHPTLAEFDNPFVYGEV